MYQPWLDEGFARPGARRTRDDFEIAATCHLQITTSEDERRAVVDGLKPRRPQTFSQALADSSDNVKALARDGAVLAGHLNDSASWLDTALIDADLLLKAVDSQKIAGIVELCQLGRADCASKSGKDRFHAEELFQHVRQAERIRR